MERFILDDDLDVANPYPGGDRRHYDKGTPVTLSTEGRLFPVICDKLRAEDGRDKTGQAAVVLREDG